MFNRAICLSVAAAAAAGVLLGPAGVASAVGHGTFTRITAPSGTTTVNYDGRHPGSNHIIVSGDTSSDVTSVDIDCTNTSANGPSAHTLASSVPVTSRAFSA